MNLEDTQLQLFEDSLKTICGMRKELQQQTDYIVSATAHQMAEEFRELPTRVRQELLVLMEQYQDDPDRLVLAIRMLEQKMAAAADSPWAKFQRSLKGNGSLMSQGDWKQVVWMFGSLALILFTAWTMSYAIPAFKESQLPPPQQVR